MNLSSRYPAKWPINRFIVVLLLRRFSAFCEILISDWLDDVIHVLFSYSLLQFLTRIFLCCSV